MTFARLNAYAVTIVVFVSCPAVVCAGPYADDLAKCLVSSATPADKSNLVQWMIAAASLHPDVKSMTKVSDQQRRDLNQKFASMVETLLTQPCRAQAQDALKYEGPRTLETSFGVLGNIAGRELFDSPSVTSGMSDLKKLLDTDKLKKALEPSN